MIKTLIGRNQRGLTLIELMVTVIILSVGLLGMAGLQSRLQQSEMEAYQRSQALLLVSDMANRIAANRLNADDYDWGASAPLGVDDECPDNAGARWQRDASEWCGAIQGAAEVEEGSGNSVGAIIGGRGCVESIGSGQYLITVAWQGLNPVSAPPASVSCGQGLYDDADGTPCADDLCRRVVTTIVQVAPL